jgi:glycosyltransferase involved in cell wall biosynthesis
MNDKSLISVIIPVYQAEKYLNQCIDSVLHQTFKDWELLLIDDGSTDKSGQICDDYAAKDSRIKVFHNQNKGVSEARNFGIDHANGKFISFIDSDDYVSNDYISVMLDKIGDYDCLAFSNRIIYKDGTANIKELFNKVFIGKEEVEQALKILKIGRFGDQLGMPWNKLYRRDILNKYSIRFPNDIWFREDEIFAYRYTEYCNSLITISQCLYQYRENESGLSAAKRSSEDYDNLSNYIYEYALKIKDEEFKARELQRSLEYNFAAFCCSSGFKYFNSINQRYKQVSNIIDPELFDRTTSRVLYKILTYPIIISFPLLCIFKKLKGKEGEMANY